MKTTRLLTSIVLFAGLSAANWVSVATTPVVVNGEKQVPVSPAVGNGFYRLKYQP